MILHLLNSPFRCLGFLLNFKIVCVVVELCCTKLGQLPDFLQSCVNLITYAIPRYIPKQNQFDLMLLVGYAVAESFSNTGKCTIIV